MLIYLLPIFLIFILSFFEKRYKNDEVKLFIQLISISIILIFFGLSSSRGDYYSYTAYFYDLDVQQDLLVNIKNSPFEIFFTVFSIFLKYLSQHESVFFLGVVFLSFLIKFFALRNLKQLYHINISLYMCVYICLFIVYLESGAIRFAIAASFFLLGFSYLVHKCIWKYYIFCLIGVCFHYSSIVMLMLPLFINFKRFFFIVAILIFSILLFESNKVFSFLLEFPYLSKLGSYNSEYQYFTINLQFIRYFFVFFIFYLFYRREVVMKNSIFHLLFSIALYSFFLTILFSFNSLVVSRFLLFFSSNSEILMLLFIIRKIKYEYAKFISTLFLFLFLTMNFLLSISKNTTVYAPYLPYKTYINDDYPKFLDIKLQE